MSARSRGPGLLILPEHSMKIVCRERLILHEELVGKLCCSLWIASRQYSHLTEHDS